MKEKNYDKLRKALDQLPQYDPPKDIWGNIARRLTPGLSERLPSYCPPASVWNNLSQDLDKLEKSRRPVWHTVSIAASILLLIGLGISWLGPFDSGPKEVITYSREQSPIVTLADWDDDEYSFQRIIEAIDKRNDPKLNALRYELEELTDAKQEIKEILMAYGENPQIVRQLTDIERDRSDIYRRIIIDL